MGFERTSCWEPDESAGVAKVSVFRSLKVTAILLPPSVTFVPDSKPLPRKVTVVPPEMLPVVGLREPIPSGMFAS